MLPEKFIKRMKAMLGESFAEFDAALSSPPVRAIRVNKSKISPEEFEKIFEGKIKAIPYADGGYIPDVQSGLGALAEHHAGMYYCQDPGAMATVSALDIKPDFKVLDTCSAPGGKSSQIADKLASGGFILSNEIVPKRAKIIVGNFERLGITNAMVTSIDTKEFPKMFRSYFDLVLCDAPCSGEGMFRKSDEALEDWSEENVLACAERQLSILENCASVVAPSGYLLYSTCTYSLEENEMVVDKFLSAHPEFSIAEVSEELKSATVPGITPSGSPRSELAKARRFYPHVSEGEGQFIALLKKEENFDELPTILYKDAAKSPTKQELNIIQSFLSENLDSIPNGRIIKQGEGFALVMHGMPIPERSVFMPGVMLGEIRGKNFFPHHQLFTSFGKLFKRKADLSGEPEKLYKYLRGEEIETDSKNSGYVAILYHGASLGGGKISSGKIKNHYPKGLRTKG